LNPVKFWNLPKYPKRFADSFIEENSRNCNFEEQIARVCNAPFIREYVGFLKGQHWIHKNTIEAALHVSVMDFKEHGLCNWTFLESNLTIQMFRDGYEHEYERMKTFSNQFMTGESAHFYLEHPILLLVTGHKHFFACVVDPTSKTIEIDDGYNTDHSEKFAALMTWYQNEHESRGFQVPNMEGWKFEQQRQTRVLQHTGTECGPLAFARLRFWMHHQRFPDESDFTESDMPAVRRFMGWLCLRAIKDQQKYGGRLNGDAEQKSSPGPVIYVVSS
jgi:hypothetical protein